MLLLEARGDALHRLSQLLMVVGLVDVGGVRVAAVVPHRPGVGIDVLDQPQLLVLLVPGDYELHLVTDVLGRLVREDDYGRNALAQPLHDEGVGHDLLAYERGAVHHDVGADGHSAQQQVVEARDPGLDLPFLYLQGALLLPVGDLILDQSLLPQAQLLLLGQDVLLLGPKLVLLVGHLGLQGLELLHQLGLLQPSGLPLHLLKLLPLRGVDLLAVHQVLFPADELVLLVGDGLPDAVHLLLPLLQPDTELVGLLLQGEELPLLGLQVLQLAEEIGAHRAPSVAQDRQLVVL